MILITTMSNRDEVFNLTAAARALDWQVFPSGWKIPAHIKGKSGSVYGPEYFCEIIADQMKWELLSNPWDWIIKLPEKYSNRKSYSTTLSAAKKLTEEFFIKAVEENIVDSKNYKDGTEIKSPSALDHNIVIVSEPLIFTSKYRCFIKDRTVITSCCYSYKDWNKEIEFNSPFNYNKNHTAVVAFVNEMLLDKEVECINNCVIDVGRFKKDTYAIIESKSAYTAELYGCDAAAALDVIAGSVILKG